MGSSAFIAFAILKPYWYNLGDISHIVSCGYCWFNRGNYWGCGGFTLKYMSGNESRILCT